MDDPLLSTNDFLTGEEIQSLTAMLKRLSSLNTDGRVGRLFTPTAFDKLEESILEVRRNGGRGRVYLDIDAGIVQAISTEIKRKVT